MKLVKPERISLKTHPELDERWLQDRIAEDPTILGLGELILLNKELIQPRAGRLDLLLRDPGSNQRYEVEIQLGRTDETHIIRTLEYWDIEKKRYPQYEHTAVIIAEDITSRFLNVISLFNGFIPLVAIQVAALKVGDHLTLIFTKVLDQVSLGEVDEDLEVQTPASRSYWEDRSSKASLAIVDDVMAILRTLEPSLEPRYNKHFVGLTRNGKPENFVVFQPRKQWVRVGLALEQSEDAGRLLDSAGLKAEFDPRWRRYVVNLEAGDVERASAGMREVLARALKEWD